MSFNNYIKSQPKAIKMLVNSYYKNRLAHAYLFEGEKGTKKKEIAIEFVKMLFCESDDKPCDMCINCLRIEHGNHPNVLVLESDNNSIKKEQVLYLQKEYSKTALEPGPKVYIIVDIDKMSINASNSILKFIEEPQPNTYIILTTENIYQILPTIISRTQVIKFQPVPKTEIVDSLIEKNVDLNIALICSHLTNDVDKAYEIATDNNIVEVIELVKKIRQAIIKKEEDPIVICDVSPIDIYKDKKILAYFLDILLIYEQDIQHLLNNNDGIVFKSEEMFLKKHVNLINMDKIVKNINNILKAKINLDYNANTVLLIDSLLISIK